MDIFEANKNEKEVGGPRDLEDFMSEALGEKDEFRLTRTDGYSLNAGPDWDGGRVLEYSEPDSESVFLTVEVIKPEKLRDAFQSFLKGDERWRNNFEWLEADAKGISPLAVALFVFIVGALLFGALANV